MIHTKITNVLLFILIASIWFLSYLSIEIQFGIQENRAKEDIRDMKKEFLDWKLKKKCDLQPELEPEPISLTDFQIKEYSIDVPGVFIDPRTKAKHGNR